MLRIVFGPFVASLLACASAPVHGATSVKARIDLDLREVSIYDALRALAVAAKVNVDADPGFTGTVTLHAHAIPWDQALSMIARQHGLRVTVSGPVLHVSSAAAPAAPTRSLNGAPMAASFDDTPIRDAANTIAEAAHTRITVDDDIDVRVTLHLREVPCDLALDHLVRKYSLRLVRERDGLRITRP